jgi:hypothetical protein
MLHRVKVRPLYVFETSEQLHVETRRIVGYRVVCSCTWRSKVHRTVSAARVEARAHHRPGG